MARATESRVCEVCGQSFVRESRFMTRPRSGRYCSKSCASSSKSGQSHKSRRREFEQLGESAALIHLTRGFAAIVDLSMADWLSQWNWHFSGGYAVRDMRRGSSLFRVPMHRTVIEYQVGMLPKNLLVDHKNRNGLDNRQENLRVATANQNAQNRRPGGKASCYRGVSFRRGHWSKHSGFIYFLPIYLQ